jgi:hypothetical protein
MCDTFAPLYPTKAALDLDDLNYPRSWEHGWEPSEAATNGHAAPAAKAPAKSKKAATTAAKPAKAKAVAGTRGGKSADTWN